MRVVFLGRPEPVRARRRASSRSASAFEQISTGDILREHRAGGTALGRQREGYMDRGELVPDDLVIEMIEAELRNIADGIRDGRFPAHGRAGRSA